MWICVCERRSIQWAEHQESCNCGPLRVWWYYYIGWLGLFPSSSRAANSRTEICSQLATLQSKYQESCNWQKNVFSFVTFCLLSSCNDKSMFITCCQAPSSIRVLTFVCTPTAEPTLCTRGTSHLMAALSQFHTVWHRRMKWKWLSAPFCSVRSSRNPLKL